MTMKLKTMRSSWELSIKNMDIGKIITDGKFDTTLEVADKLLYEKIDVSLLRHKVYALIHWVNIQNA